MTKEELFKTEGTARGLKIITRDPEAPETGAIEYVGINFNHDENQLEIIVNRQEHGANVASVESLPDEHIKKVTLNDKGWLILDFSNES